MKFSLVLFFLFSAFQSHAGVMSEIPIPLLDLDNQGRLEFMKNALANTGLSDDASTEYRDFESYIIGGDEPGSNFNGAFFGFRARLLSFKNGHVEFLCEQLLAVGDFPSDLTRPIDCVKSMQ